MPDALDPAELCRDAKNLMREGQYGSAEARCREAIALDADCLEAHEQLGTILFLRNDHQEALSQFLEVVRIDPTHTTAYINAGAVCNRLGELDRAIELLRQAIEVGPPMARAFYNLGVVYRRQGDTTRAMDAYRETTHVDPNMADAHHNLGNCFAELGRYAEAIASYERALEIQPDFRRAKNARAKAKAAQDAEDRREGPATTEPEPEVALEDADRERPLPKDRAGARHQFQESLGHCERAMKAYLEYLETVLDPGTRDLSTALLRSAQMVFEDLSPIVEQHLQAIEAGEMTLKELLGTVAAMRQRAEHMVAVLEERPAE